MYDLTLVSRQAVSLKEQYALRQDLRALNHAGTQFEDKAICY
jgi:hypothetical protein